MDIANEIKKGNKRAAAKLISMIENQDEEAAVILRECGSDRKKSRIIGITGPPGSGKSTLTDQVAKILLKNKKKVGIIAVDPSSAITGGAFLGDRVRMSDLNGEADIFIRSMGTRGALGGISKAVQGAVRVLEALGMDHIFIETVGIGQSEVDVADVADTVVFVTIPGMGDDIQAEKAGIMEVADVIAVNKSDHDGVTQTIKYLKSRVVQNKSHETHIISTIAVTGSGIEELLAAIGDHYDWLLRSGRIGDQQREHLKSELLDLVSQKFKVEFERYNQQKNVVDRSAEAILSSDADPYSEAELLLQDFMEWRVYVNENRSSGDRSEQP